MATYDPTPRGYTAEPSEGTNSFYISPYEHHQILIPQKEIAGQAPVPLKRWEKEREARISAPGYKKGAYGPDDDEGASKVGKTGKIWRTIRRRDGKTFLATEYHDNHKLMDAVKETLLRLLNHPNLISLVDVVHDTNVSLWASDYTVWEDCTGGTLNRLLWRKNEKDEPVDIPEGLCWHVLDGISQALLWLHHGHKHTFPFNHHMEHDDDWHPILFTDITPANIHFATREGEETYGDVKLGNFRSAAVNSSPAFIKAIRPPWIPQHGIYTAPEIRRNLAGLSDASEVWALGAILYHMMAGTPPIPIDTTGAVGNPTEDDFWVRALPRKYSSSLRKIVMGMLRVNPEARPTVDDLSVVVDAGWAEWREKTEEGRTIILKGRQKISEEDKKEMAKIEALIPKLIKAGSLDDL